MKQYLVNRFAKQELKDRLGIANLDAHRFDVVEAVERSLLQRVTGETSSEPITRLESGLTA